MSLGDFMSFDATLTAPSYPVPAPESSRHRAAGREKCFAELFARWFNRITKWMSDFRNSVREVVSIALELTRSRTIWWEIARQENTEKYADTIYDHRHFYSTLRFSLEQGMFMMICQLFETRDNTKSIPNLIRELEGSNPDMAKKLRQEIQALKPLLGKMFHVRGASMRTETANYRRMSFSIKRELLRGIWKWWSSRLKTLLLR